jgi:ubiquinone/menaquinone biosynthesis C-methylase UbiE
MASGADDSVARVREVFDAFGGEWDRLRKDVAGRVSFEIHRRFLDEYLTPGARVLEAGAGPGTFTRHMAARGARLTVTDLSPAQLADRRRRIAEAGLGGVVEEFGVADVRDLSRWAGGSFDLAVAYGGPLSYVFEDAPAALRELLRVTRPGGTVIASVMSTLGSYRSFMPGVADIIADYGDDVGDAVLHTGDLRPVQPAGHVCMMYRAEQIPGLVAQAGGTLAGMSASNWSSLGDSQALARLEADPAHWARFLDNETWACRQPGCLNGGTHLILAIRHHGEKENEHARWCWRAAAQRLMSRVRDRWGAEPGDTRFRAPADAPVARSLEDLAVSPGLQAPRTAAPAAGSVGLRWPAAAGADRAGRTGPG